MYLLTIHNPCRTLWSSSHHLLSVGYTCELFHLRVVTNTLPLLTGTIYLMTLETVPLSVGVFKRKLKSSF